jgi:hypothetical protein
MNLWILPVSGNVSYLITLIFPDHCFLYHYILGMLNWFIIRGIPPLFCRGLYNLSPIQIHFFRILNSMYLSWPTKFSLKSTGLLENSDTSISFLIGLVEKPIQVMPSVACYSFLSYHLSIIMLMASCKAHQQVCQ